MSAALGRLMAFAEQGVWFAYLLLFAGISFVTGGYASSNWMLISTGFYALCSLYLVLIGLGSGFNSRAIYRARWVLLPAVLSIGWLWLQTCLPSSSLTSAGVIVDQSSLPWFKPDYLISVDVARTRQLIHLQVFVLAWMLLSLSLLRNRRRVKQLLGMLVVVLVLHAISGIGAKLTGQFLIDKQQIDGHFSAARGWFVNRNHFAAFVLCCLGGVMPWLINVHSSSVNAIKVSFAGAGVLIASAAIVMSQSRAGLLCLIVCIVLAFVACLNLSRIHSGTNPISRRITATLFLVLLVLIVLGLIGFGGELLGRVQAGFLSLGERTLQWQITWRAILENPLYGYGGGSYAQIFQAFRDHADLRETIFDQSHNDYLHIWLEQGLLGISLWLVFLFIVVLRSWHAATRSSSSFVRSVVSAGLIVLFAALLQSLVDFNLQIVSLRCYFFVIIALVMATPTIHHKRFS